mgnify:CR=1 FL=1
MIKISKVRYKNFLSTGNQFTEISLDKSPTTLIMGKNGSGKSTILDAIYFGLFGKPFRNINKPNLVNSINRADLSVELFFEISAKQYKIVRGLRPATFEIYCDGVLINQDSATRDYQAHLEENILNGLNERVFKQVIVIGSADYKPFMQLSASARREVIEELLDIKNFSQMMVLVKEKLSIQKDMLKDIDFSVELLTEKIQLHNQHVEAEIKKTESRIQDIDIQIDGLKIEIKESEDKLLDYKEKIQKADDILLGSGLVQTSYDLVISKQKELALQKKIILETKTFFEKHDSCQTCKQNITETHKDSVLTGILQNLQDIEFSEKTNQEVIDSKRVFLDKFEKMQKIKTVLLKSVFSEENNITTKRKYISYLETDKNKILHEVLKDSNNELESVIDLKALEKELENHKNRRKTFLEEREYLEAVANMLKDGGIKTKIIKQYVPVMNKIINEYLIRFGLPIEFTLDEQFNEVIKSRYRDGFQYNNFSEGEKQRIDMALLLAWRHLAKSKNTANTNLLILDETFDSSLDATATEELLNILLEMDRSQSNIFIISHKQDLSDKLRSTIEFEKPGNFSIMKRNT